MIIRKYGIILSTLVVLIFSFTVPVIADNLQDETSLLNILNKITYIDIVSSTNNNEIVFKNIDDFYRLLFKISNTNKDITIFRKKSGRNITFSIIVEGTTYSINSNGFKSLANQYFANKSGFNNYSVYQEAKDLNISSYQEYTKYLQTMEEYQKYRFLSYEDYLDAKKIGLFSNLTVNKIYYPLMFPVTEKVNIFNKFMNQFNPTFKLQKFPSDDYKKYFKAINGHYYRLQLSKGKDIPELPFNKALAPSFTYYYMKLLSIENLSDLKLYLKYISSNNIIDNEKAYSLKAIFDSKFIYPLIREKYYYDLGQIRARASDDNPVTVIIHPVIAYDKLDQYIGIFPNNRTILIDKIRHSCPK